MALIEPRTLKGFRDYLPEAMIPRERLIDTARTVYRSYGFSPIDTPALEYEEILTGKGGEESDKQMYRFEDNGGRKVALRFDLTIPLARFAAQHINELGTPFKRYHIASVWRGENTQRGRYREFMQCDFDTIGTESIVSDIEMVLVVHDLLRAIGFEKFTIRVNNRKLLAGLLEGVGIQDGQAAVLRCIDKLDKQGRAKVEEELQSVCGLTPQGVRNVMLLTAEPEGSLAAPEQLAAIDPTLVGLIKSTASGRAGWEQLEAVVSNVCATLGNAQRVRVDLSIARGLDYYTGTVLETSLDDLPGIGSVCSGGRYDDLAQLYTKQRLPGIGASLGLDRLLSAMEELGMLEKRRTGAKVFLAYFDASRLHDYLKLARDIRALGLGVELYPEPKKLDAQLKYADKRGFEIALVLGESEWNGNTCQVKQLATRQSTLVDVRDASGALSPELRALLA
ncbi:MAG: histidine--tRNA ligase [Planctomycetota bacterium]